MITKPSSFIAYTLAAIAFLPGWLFSQDMRIGAQLGSNYSLPHTIITFEGKKERTDNSRVGMPKLGYSLKGFGLIPLGRKSALLATLGYEQLRYESYSLGLRTVRINNLGAAISQAYTLYKPLEMFVGGEVVYRWGDSDGGFRSLGKSVQNKIYLQGFAGLGYRRADHAYIRLDVLLPALQTSAFPVDATFQRDRVEVIDVLRLYIGIPII